jgi:hypothetical protein
MCALTRGCHSSSSSVGRSLGCGDSIATITACRARERGHAHTASEAVFVASEGAIEVDDELNAVASRVSTEVDLGVYGKTGMCTGCSSALDCASAVSSPLAGMKGRCPKLRQ